MRKKSTPNFLYNMMFFFLFFSLVFLGIFYNSFSSFSDTLKENIERNILIRTSENSYYIKESVENLQSSLEILASMPEVKTMNWAEQEPVLRSLTDRYKIESIQIADLKGEANSTKGYLEYIGVKGYFKEALNGLNSISELTQREYDGKNVILCSTPIYNENEQIIGVFIAHMDPQTLFSSIENIRYGSTGYGFIVNNEGYIMAQSLMKIHDHQVPYHMDQDWKGCDAYEAIKAKILRGEIGHDFCEHDGREYFMAYSPIVNTDWSLVVSVERDDIFYEVDAVTDRFMVVFISLVLITVLFTFFCLRYYGQYKKMLRLKEDTENSNRLLLEAKEIDRIRTEFFANVSHELRTPLNVIYSSLQLLTLYLKNQTHLEREKAQKHFNIIKRNSMRLNRLINNLIDTTRINANFYELHAENCNIVGIIRDINVSIEDYIRKKGIEFSFITDVEEKVLYCDVDKIERILLNLLSNAIKFTDEGGKVTISLTDHITSVCISVADTGVGIPADKVDHIFARFHQVDKTFSKNYYGSGIGLSLVKSMVEMHGGTVHVTSEPGKGSVFSVELPALQMEQQTGADVYQYDIDQFKHRIEIEMADLYGSSSEAE